MCVFKVARLFVGWLVIIIIIPYGSNFSSLCIEKKRALSLNQVCSQEILYDFSGYSNNNKNYTQNENSYKILFIFLWEKNLRNLIEKIIEAFTFSYMWISLKVLI